ncbi:hypothetical protein ALC53_00014, partial [Atta colombica]
KRFTSNEEVIAETEAYFEGFVSYYRKGIEMLENRYTLLFIKNPGTFQSM